MSWTLRTAGRALAATALTAAALAGCSFAKPPTGAAATSHPHVNVVNPVAVRLLDAPALLTQCIVDRRVLSPQYSGTWFTNGRVRINSGNAQDFASWWRAFVTTGPYAQTFLIDGHRTHYLAFGAHWTVKNGRWVPLHRNSNDPMTRQTSLYAWSLWTATHQRLPAAVCGPGVSARALQQEIFGSRADNPWPS